MSFKPRKNCHTGMGTDKSYVKGGDFLVYLRARNSQGNRAGEIYQNAGRRWKQTNSETSLRVTNPLISAGFSENTEYEV